MKTLAKRLGRIKQTIDRRRYPPIVFTDHEPAPGEFPHAAVIIYDDVGSDADETHG
jgi:hypothetical protein